ncbi:MAG: hypothetical protein H6695_08620 [Deferribacteres bacterium]|nr:hypothetical protein [Deferribacteres bacterium]
MADSEKISPTNDHTPSAASRSKNIMKWIAGATAVLSLIFGLQQLVGWVFEYRAQKREITEQLELAKMQRTSSDYHAAWGSLEKAYVMDQQDREVNEARENLAMEWLENISVKSGEETFTDIVNRILPALSRGVLKAEGQRKADLLAHIGWADFLRWRDGNFALKPEASYQKALAIDSSNVYAHVMWAHWILWRNGEVAEAAIHFKKAVASGRVRLYVRDLQLSALLNLHNEDTEDELVRVCHEMWRNDETIEDRHKRRIWSVYSSISGRIRRANTTTGQFRTIIDPVEELATFRWLFENWERTANSPVYQYILACLQEAAGEDEAALKTFQALRQNSTSRNLLLPRIDAGIRRVKAKLVE